VRRVVGVTIMIMNYVNMRVGVGTIQNRNIQLMHCVRISRFSELPHIRLEEDIH